MAELIVTEQEARTCIRVLTDALTRMAPTVALCTHHAEYLRQVMLVGAALAGGE